MDEPLTEDDSASPRDRRGCGTVVAGLLLILVGIPMLVCPGPGTAVILAGAGMVAAGIGLSRRAG